MLKFNKIQIDNFGPFKDSQVVEFPNEDGVSIIYGENMRGKTILLNAIRYALFGKVLGRGAKEMSIHQLSNWELAEKGIYGFKVILTLTHDNNNYELTRTCSPKNDQITPETNRDYRQEVYLEKNGIVLGPEERDNELSRIMPEQVSRFFLFDGELLQEYEELLREESEMGDRIKMSIERILGVPILINARADLHDQVKFASKKLSKAAQEDQETSEIGKHISSLNEVREFHEKEIKDLEKEYSSLIDQRNALQESLTKYEKVRYLMVEKDQFEREIKKIDEKIVLIKKETKELMSKAWIGILSKNIIDIRKQYTKELQKLNEIQTKKVADKEVQKLIQKAIKSKTCPICKSSLEKSQVASLKSNEKEIEKEDDGIDSRIQLLHHKTSTLDMFDIDDNTDVVCEKLNRIDELIIEQVNHRDRINEIDEQTRDFDQSEVRQFMSEKDNVVKLISNVEEGLEKERAELKETEDNIRKLGKRLESSGGTSFEKEKKYSEISQALFDLFRESVDEYRDRLRKVVENDASEIFLELTSEPDYSGLKINDSYGLTIVHKDGRLIPVRSAGAEHIVALSLMGSLQRNAPLRGPIIMDSPFGRLDEVHTTRVVHALPKMADQVILLVYESELNPKAARDSLKGKLISEYKLQRISAKHTSIEKMI